MSVITEWPELDADIQTLLPEIISIRHHLHQYPELSNREFTTSQFIARKLKEFGISFQAGIAGTGIVAQVNCERPGICRAFRAELDALPLTERTELSYASKVRAFYPMSGGGEEETGVMHACGHDVHMAMVLGFARLVATHSSKFTGSFKFIFQPAEEGAPDGENGGARQMIKEGVLASPVPDVCIGLHVTAGPLGEYRIGQHRTTASADTFRLEITGKSTHAAFPWTGIDPVPIAAQIISAWQTIPARQANLSQSMPPVITVGRIYGGQRHNILADKVILEGTVRTVDNEQRDFVLERMSAVSQGLAEPIGASVNMTLSSNNYIAGKNAPLLVESIVPLLSQISPYKVVVDGGTYGTDDFAEYAQRLPGLFIRMGATPPELAASGEYIWPTHSDKFVADDRAIFLGIKTFSLLSLHLNNKK